MLHESLRAIIENGGCVGNDFPPSALNISITDNCTSHCRYCWRNKETLFSPGLSLESLIEVIEQARSMGIMNLSLVGGGEPLVRSSDVLRLIEYAKKRGMYCDLITNLCVDEKTILNRVVDSGLDCLLISIDSPHHAINDFLRGEGVTRKVIHNINYLNTLKDRPHLCTLSVITEKNYGSIGDMVLFGIDNRIDHVLYCRLTNDSPFYDELKIKNIDLLHEQICKAIQMAHNKIHTNLDQFTDSVIAKIDTFLSEPGKEIMCYEPWLEPTINAHGEVLPCCNTHFSMGNINDSSLSDIWYGDQYNDFRRQWTMGHYYTSCRNCDLDYYYRKLEIQHGLHLDEIVNLPKRK